MEKIGELTSTQLVTIILAIAGFVVVLMIISILDFKQYSEDELCKLSVLTRATSPEIAQRSIPLKCYTKKYCLTNRFGGECSQFAGEQGVVTISIGKDPDKAARIIESVSANAMYSCWKMMGQGKLDIFGSYATSRGFVPVRPICVICSRVAVDMKMDHKFIEETSKKVNINNYLANNKPEGEVKTYLQLFTDSEFRAYPKIDENLFIQKLDSLPLADDGVITNNNGEIAFVFMQIKSKEIVQSLLSLGQDGLIIAGSTFTTPFLGTVAKKLILTGPGLAVTGVAAVGTATFSALNVWQGQTIASGYCGEFVSQDTEEKGGGKEGCSIVQAVPYNFREINNLCEEIDGNL